ncbi:MAG: hypothetical protein AAB074_11210 [Planctomycetota bacterium]
MDPVEPAPLLPPAENAGSVGGRAAAGPVLCPNCAVNWPADTVLCVRCGLNLQTGENVAPPTPAAAEAEQEPETRLERFAARFPGLFRPKTLVASLIVLALAGGCFVLCVILMSMGVVMTAATAGGVGLILYAQAVAWVLTGEIQLLVEAMTEFDGPRWNAFFLALAIPLTLAFAFMGLRGPKE